MIQCKYHRVVFLDDVVKVLKEYDGKAHTVAGGTGIMIQIHKKNGRWKDLQCLLDITYLGKELRYISQDEEYVYIDPLSTHMDLEQPEAIAKHIPFLGQASATIGSPQIQSRGTLGGSIDNAFPVSDPLPAPIAADVLTKAYGQDGEWVCLLRGFYEGEGNLKLELGEFVREFVVRKLPEGIRAGFSKLDRRKALAISRLNYTAALTMDSEGTTTEARIAPGCIFILPDRMEKAEQVLVGQKPSGELFAKVGKAVSEVMMECTGVRWSTQHKESAVQEVVLRALYQAIRMEVQQWRRRK